MHQPEVYVDLDGREICLGHLDTEERNLFRRIRRHARSHADWNAFDNYWTRAVGDFYDARGVPRTVSRQNVLYRVGQDLSSRIALAGGFARPGDYRDELEELIQEKFPNRRTFCKAAGLSEDMLSHVLKGRKHLSLESLTKALDRIGYKLRILPALPGEPLKQPSVKRRKPAAQSA